MSADKIKVVEAMLHETARLHEQSAAASARSVVSVAQALQSAFSKGGQALLFGNGDRHVTAEILHEEAVKAGERVSLATVYNTLHQFERAGLLREIAIGGQRAYFDTNISNHNHFFVEAEGRLVDIPGSSIRVDGLPEPPEHLEISHIDVVVRLVRK